MTTRCVLAAATVLAPVMAAVPPAAATSADPSASPPRPASCRNDDPVVDHTRIVRHGRLILTAYLTMHSVADAGGYIGFCTWFQPARRLRHHQTATARVALRATYPDGQPDGVVGSVLSFPLWREAGGVGDYSSAFGAGSTATATITVRHPGRAVSGVLTARVP